jgi:hypothetical protein
MESQPIERSLMGTFFDRRGRTYRKTSVVI